MRSSSNQMQVRRTLQLATILTGFVAILAGSSSYAQNGERLTSGLPPSVRNSSSSVQANMSDGTHGLPPAEPPSSSASSQANFYTRSTQPRQPETPSSDPSPPAWRTANPEPIRNESPFVQSASFHSPALTSASQLPISVPNISTESAVEAKEAGAKPSGLALKSKGTSTEGKVTRPNSSVSAFISVLFSLGVVLSLFMGVAWLYKKSQPQGSSRLANEMVQILGRTPLSPRNSMYVIRFGSKLVLVSDHAGHTEALSEITDPVEVERLIKLSQSPTAENGSSSFKSVFRQVAGLSS